jgi:hypothetical protein
MTNKQKKIIDIAFLARYYAKIEQNIAMIAMFAYMNTIIIVHGWENASEETTWETSNVFYFQSLIC